MLKVLTDDVDNSDTSENEKINLQKKFLIKITNYTYLEVKWVK